MLRFHSTRMFIATVMGSVLGLAALAPRAEAILIVSIQQVGGNVVATATGSITATSNSNIGLTGDFIIPSSAALTFGPNIPGGPAAASYILTGPGSFGGGGALSRLPAAALRLDYQGV